MLVLRRVEPKILIAEDDPWMQGQLVAALDGRGYELMSAANGLTALARASADVPDLIVSDVVMPVMDGWTLLKRVRHNPRLASVPFIVLSAHATPQDLQRGYRLGADDYVPKPFDATDLAGRVAYQLARTSRTSRAYERPSEPATGLGFSGSLVDIGCAALLSLLEQERRSGMLIVREGEERGRVFVRDGRVVSARLDRGPALTNAEAVYWMLRWSTGKFEFRALTVEMDDEVRCPTALLVLEGTRRLAEARDDAAVTL